MKKQTIFFLLIVSTLSVLSLLEADCLNSDEVIGSRIPLSLQNRAPTAIGSSGGPFVSLDPVTGNYFILKTFSSPSNDPTRPFDIQTVQGQVFDFMGSAVSAPINFETGYFLSEPFGTAAGVTFNSNRREFFVSWLVRFKNSATAPDVRHQLRSQIVSSDGTLIGSKQILLQTNPSNVSLHFHESIYNPNTGQFVILYSFLNSSSTQENLFVQKVDIQGRRIGKPTKVNTQSTSIITTPEMKRSSRTNRFLVAWNASNDVGSQDFFQILSSGLQKIGINQNVESQSSEQSPPQVTYLDSTDEFTIFWNTNFTDTIEARIIRSDGTFGGTILKLALKGFLEDARFDPRTKKFMVIYQKPVGPVPLQKKNLMIAKLNQNHGIIRKDIRITCQAGSRVAPRVLLISNSAKGEFFAVWKFLRQDDVTFFDIYAQRVKSAS